MLGQTLVIVYRTTRTVLLRTTRLQRLLKPVLLEHLQYGSVANTTKTPAEGKPSKNSPSLSSKVNEIRSEEHTSELQSRFDLVCRLLLEKKKSRTRLCSRTFTYCSYSS